MKINAEELKSLIRVNVPESDERGGYLVPREYSTEIIFRLIFPNTPPRIREKIPGWFGLVAWLGRFLWGEYYATFGYDSPLFSEFKRRRGDHVVTREEALREKMSPVKVKWRALLLRGKND